MLVISGDTITCMTQEQVNKALSWFEYSEMYKERFENQLDISLKQEKEISVTDSLLTLERENVEDQKAINDSLGKDNKHLRELLEKETTRKKRWRSAFLIVASAVVIYITAPKIL